MLIEDIDTWMEKKLLTSLMSSPFFKKLADECQDICTQEKLSICCRWVVNGCPEEHFLTVLHVKSTDAETITDTLTSFISEKNLDYSKLVAKGTMEQQHFQVIALECRPGCRCMQLMPSNPLFLPQTTACFHSSC